MSYTLIDEVPVFPRPLVRMAFPPLQCLCTWAVSPEIYGTADKPFVLKIYYGLCPVPGHRTRAAIGASIAERVRNDEGQGQRQDSTERAEGPGKNRGSGIPEREGRLPRLQGDRNARGQSVSHVRRNRRSDTLEVKGNVL